MEDDGVQEFLSRIHDVKFYKKIKPDGTAEDWIDVTYGPKIKAESAQRWRRLDDDIWRALAPSYEAWKKANPS